MSEPAFLILAVEVVVLLLGLIGAGFYWVLRQGRLDRQALQDLVSKIKSSDAPHRETLQATLGNTYKLEGEELRGVVDQLVAKERDVYRAMVGIYQNRDRSRLTSFNEAVESLVALGLELVPKTNDEAFEKAIAILTEERDRIGQELEATKSAFANVMDEYTAAFNKERSRAAEIKASEAVESTDSASDDGVEVTVEQDPMTNVRAPGKEQLFNTLDALDAALGMTDVVVPPAPPAGRGTSENIAKDQPLPDDAVLPEGGALAPSDPADVAQADESLTELSAEPQAAAS